MRHIEELKKTKAIVPEDFLTAATGRFYTPEALALNLINSMIEALEPKIGDKKTINIVDPFGGDGRLVTWFIEEWTRRKLPNVSWNIELWDVNGDDLSDFEKVNRERLPYTTLTVTTRIGDSFLIAQDCSDKFDVVITNPPWEMLKPDSRELSKLAEDVAKVYQERMREYDALLTRVYPMSQPVSKFAGWGTNLSRVGFEVSLGLLKPEGILGAVMPASFLADQQSVMLRENLLLEHTLFDVAYYPAEAKLFSGADTSASTLVVKNKRSKLIAPRISLYESNLKIMQSDRVTVDEGFLKLNDYILPITMGVYSIELLQKFQEQFEPFSKLENSGNKSLWVGREVDETGITKRLVDAPNKPLFIKGRMINRFRIVESPTKALDNVKPPVSVDRARIVWRDVSRPSQKRRLIATLIPEGFIAGNSLGVAYFKDNSDNALRALLGIMSSVIFEFQLRCHLANGHVSLSALRKVYLPPREVYENDTDLQRAVQDLFDDPASEVNNNRLEAIVARYIFDLSKADFAKVLRIFPTITSDEQNGILKEFDKLPRKKQKRVVIDKERKNTIPNHLSATLSELDMRMVYSIPPGGNWKNIPLDIPSKRLDQIRESFKQGKGSRSTYYGRLHPDMPSYTITTYFNRPGNGCHVHYSQNRVMSQREAARLQGFPDDFVFLGSQNSVNTQIGNAVPPLLAYQIAQTLGPPGIFIDLFSGAGGLGLGFKWAGWKPVVANDIDGHFLKTYAANVHEKVVHGSISDPEIVEQLVEIALKVKKDNPGVPFWVLGGPPCQGFSTAGRRNTDDERNKLFWDYKHFLEKVRPDGFVFENVTGLLNMEGGKVFEEVKKAFGSVMPNVDGWVLNIDDYAVPQRRKRVVLVGSSDANFKITKPEAITATHNGLTLFRDLPKVVSTKEALEDLPAILPGQDGSNLNYASDPSTIYQAFMRGLLTPDEYISLVKEGARLYS
jgi:Alw26I/Eco31I/Esp3I family type II restriction m6 adenine DNA methyltransferase